MLAGRGRLNQSQGRAGDDAYIVDNYMDSLIERANEGTDEVQHALGFYVLRQNLENLTYTGSGDFQGRGNAHHNVIRGGAGDDGLIGFNGNDMLIGGGG